MHRVVHLEWEFTVGLCSMVEGGLLIPVQPPVLASPDVPPARIRHKANSAHAVPSPQAG